MIALLIVALSFLPYMHDFKLFKGMEGFSGFSSLRIGIWVVSLFVLALSGWLFAIINAKGKTYRSIMLAPIIMLSFQLGIYLLDGRNTSTNEFSFKIVLNMIMAVTLVAVYYFNKMVKK